MNAPCAGRSNFEIALSVVNISQALSALSDNCISFSDVYVLVFLEI